MEYSNNSYQPPDLASVLRTLSALAPAQGQTPAHQQPFPYQSEVHPKDDELEEGEYDPADDYDPSQPLNPPSQAPLQPHPPSPLPASSSHALPPPPAPLQPHATPNPTTEQPYPLQHPQPQPAPPPKPTPTPKTDPSTITTYPPALRHILHLTTTTPTFLPSIQKLLTTQHRHEREWHAQRLALQSRLATRAESRSKLDDVLSALGGKVSAAAAAAGKGKQQQQQQQQQGGKLGEGEGDKEEEEEREKEMELERFDRKVWKAQVEMVRAMGRELGGWGVPGFCEGVGGRGEVGRGLRGRVVGLLEDLCGGEEEGGGGMMMRGKR